jgi:hypothetical protein
MLLSKTEVAACTQSQVYDRIRAAKNLGELLQAGDPCSCKHYIAHGKWCSCTLAALSLREKKSMATCWKPPPDETVREAMIAVFGPTKEAPVCNPVAREGLQVSDLNEASEVTIGKASAGRPRKARIPSRGHRGRRGAYKCDRCGLTGHQTSTCTGKVAKKLSGSKSALAAAKKFAAQRTVSDLHDASLASSRASTVMDTYSAKVWQDIRDLKLSDAEIMEVYTGIIVSIKNEQVEQQPQQQPADAADAAAATKQLDLRLSVVSAYKRELAAAMACRAKGGPEEVTQPREKIVKTALSRMGTTFTMLSAATKTYLDSKGAETGDAKPASSAAKGSAVLRQCFICLQVDEDGSEDMNPLVCGECSKPGLDPKWIHDECMEQYVLERLSSGVSMQQMTCPICRSERTTTAMDQAGVSGFGGPLTNVSPSFSSDLNYFCRVVEVSADNATESMPVYLGGYAAYAL